METIELAVERMRRPRRADGPAQASPLQPPAPVLPQPSSPQSRLQIKTRVLCDYSPEVHSIIAGPANAPAPAVHGQLLGVSIASAFAGAAVVVATLWFMDRAHHPAPLSHPKVATAPAVAPKTALAAVPVAAITAEQPAELVVSPGPAVPGYEALESAVRDARQVGEVVTAWAQAWSARDAGRYLGFYSPDFKPERGMARLTWENQRRQRLAAARAITVGVRDLQVEREAGDRIVVRFAQDYSAGKHRETGTSKTLVLTRGSQGWQIIAETVGFAPPQPR
jgi:ketosteroid isomerase-like protein